MMLKNPLLSQDIKIVHTTVIDALKKAGPQGLSFSNIPLDMWKVMMEDEPEAYLRLRIFFN